MEPLWAFRPPRRINKNLSVSLYIYNIDKKKKKRYKGLFVFFPLKKKIFVFFLTVLKKNLFKVGQLGKKKPIFFFF